MIDIVFSVVKLARNCIPVYTSRYVLYELTNQDRQWYIEQIAQPYFNANIKNKFNQSNALDSAKKFLDLYFDTVKHKSNTCSQIRMVIKDFLNDTLVGGITIFYKVKYKVIDLGYWVVQDYQGKGIMSEVLRKFLISLDKNLTASFSIHLEIFDSNKPSKCLAEKNYFFEMMRKTCDNTDDIIVYSLDRKKFRYQMEIENSDIISYKNQRGRGNQIEEGS